MAQSVPRRGGTDVPMALTQVVVPQTDRMLFIAPAGDGGLERTMSDELLTSFDRITFYEKVLHFHDQFLLADDPLPRRRPSASRKLEWFTLNFQYCSWWTPILLQYREHAQRRRPRAEFRMLLLPPTPWSRKHFCTVFFFFSAALSLSKWRSENGCRRFRALHQCQPRSLDSKQRDDPTLTSPHPTDPLLCQGKRVLCQS